MEAREAVTSVSTQMGRKVLFSKFMCKPVAAEKACRVSFSARSWFSSALRIIMCRQHIANTGRGALGQIGCSNTPFVEAAVINC
jgi:hypothetical protein